MVNTGDFAVKTVLPQRMCIVKKRVIAEARAPKCIVREPGELIAVVAGIGVGIVAVYAAKLYSAVVYEKLFVFNKHLS